MGGEGENTMDEAKKGGCKSLPPVCTEAAAEVADSVMVEDPLVGEKKQAMFRGVDLDLLVRGFEVEARGQEGAGRVGWAVC